MSLIIQVKHIRAKTQIHKYFIICGLIGEVFYYYIKNKEIYSLISKILI